MSDITNQCITYNSEEFNANPAEIIFGCVLVGMSFLMLGYSLVRYAEKNNRLDYAERLTRITSGFLRLLMLALHTTDDAVQLPDSGASLIALGPHRTGWESILFGSKIKGEPPRFLATDAFGNIPGMTGFMRMFKVIPVKANPSKDSRNTQALEAATAALNEAGRVALFPQGNFSYLGQAPRRIYDGVAKLAITTKTPIHVIRLDGFWSIYNPLIPKFIRNNLSYRAFLSFFHMNNVKTNLCCIIDFHLQPQNESLSVTEKVNEINAQLYAFFRHTEELTPHQIANINKEIAAGEHRPIWENKLRQYCLEKELQASCDEGKELENKSALAFGLGSI